uniref:PWWP domain-containing protein n=1 Tax=Panagrolaimus superbus TaxID=310955 RepID=A0A914XYN8_9BILA
MADSKLFEVGHLVWAKIRGYPNWPAKIIEASGNKYCVLFFGTRETAFVKASDVCDYLENRNLYEKTQNRKAEFCCAVQEIKNEAGLPPEGDEQPPPGENGGAAPVEITNNSSSFGRIRKPSARISDKDFVPFGMGSLRKRHNSNSLNFDFLDRPRTDSTGSIFGNTKRYKGPSITGDFGDFDIFGASTLLQGDLGNLLDNFDSDASNGFHHPRRRRRTTSKILDDILSGTRERNFSTSSHGGTDLKIPIADGTGIMDIFESAGSILNPSDFYHAIDQLPSEESDRPQTPENIAPMPNQNRSCPKCGTIQRFMDYTWKCPNNACNINHEIKTEYDDLESFFENGNNMVKMEPSVFSHKQPKKTKKKSKAATAENTDAANGGVKKLGRPRSYKVEKTPPVQSNGVRLCIFCNGHVRPQMCGGNKHRWRCVDKRCRKWYGWVRSNEEIPKDLGKKGRWKDLVLKVQGHTEDGKLVQMIPPPDDTPEEERLAEELKAKQRKKKKLGVIQRPLSPLTDEQLNYVPSQLELRSHWWRPDRKRTEPSPDRQFVPSNSDFAAVSRIAEQSFRASAILTKSMIASNQHVADSGTMCGFTDLMLDSAFGIIGPLLSLTSNIPHMNNNPDLRKKLFDNFEQLPVINP